MKKSIALLLFISVTAFTVSANNIQITNISTGLINGNLLINFNLTWENSWRAASTTNWDGAWVFFKFKDTDGRWKPLHFTGNNAVAPAGYIIDISSKPGSVNTGAFIFRNAMGFGPVALTNVRAGIESIPGTFDIKGFAIETVYIPQGSFYAGDGTGYSTLIDHSFTDGATLNPYHVTGDGSVTQLGNTAGKLSGYHEASLSVFLTGFPTGYKSFWMMKYEVSQGAYRDFLNTLTYVQQDSLLAFDPISPTGTALFNANIRGRLEIAIPGTWTLSGQTPAVIGCDYLDNNVYDEAGDGEWITFAEASWSAAAAYLDWACLRPFTELEFEKACRGPLPAVFNEYAWGTNQIALGGTYTLTNAGLSTEAVSNMSSVEGNAVYKVTGDVLRGGIFATATSTRINAGAGYYGVMELSGSAKEYCVTTRNLAGRSFTAKHGDGNTNDKGMADVDYWPGINGNSDVDVANRMYQGFLGTTQTAGLVERGGGIFLNAANLAISYRHSVGSQVPSASSFGSGIRGVRDSN